MYEECHLFQLRPPFISPSSWCPVTQPKWQVPRRRLEFSDHQSPGSDLLDGSHYHASILLTSVPIMRWNPNSSTPLPHTACTSPNSLKHALPGSPIPFNYPLATPGLSSGKTPLLSPSSLNVPSPSWCYCKQYVPQTRTWVTVTPSVFLSHS